MNMNAPHPRLSSPGLTGRPSIPKASAMEPRSRGVLDTPHARGTTVGWWRGRRIIAGKDDAKTTPVNPLLTIHTAKIA
jgi:hypothetical protein